MDFCSCGRRIDRFDYKNPSANARQVIDTAVEAKVRGQRTLGAVNAPPAWSGRFLPQQAPQGP